MSDDESVVGHVNPPSKDTFKEMVKEWMSIIDSLNFFFQLLINCLKLDKQQVH